MLKTAIILTVFLPSSFAITKCAIEPWSGKEKCTDVSEAELEMWNEIKKPNYTYAGHSFDWSDPQDGWNDYRRLNLLNGIKLHPEVNAKKPKYHSIGYEKLQIPSQLYDRIQSLKMPENLMDEDCYNREEIINCAKMGKNRRPNQYVSKHNTKLYSFKSQNLILESIQKYLKPILEDWVNVPMDPESLKVHGIRRYLRNSKVFPHTDANVSHIFGAILQVDQKVQEDWPFCMIGRKEEFTCVILHPGEMLIYESSTIIHFRHFPLKGDYYDNLMVHYAPLQTPKINDEL